VGGEEGDAGAGSYVFGGWLQAGWEADVAAERAVGGGQAVRIVGGRRGLTYPGVATVTWHRDWGSSC
jgi:hypothetical protein